MVMDGSKCKEERLHVSFLLSPPTTYLPILSNRFFFSPCILSERIIKRRYSRCPLTMISLHHPLKPFLSIPSPQTQLHAPPFSSLRHDVDVEPPLPCAANLCLTFSRCPENFRWASNFCAVMSGPGVYSFVVQSRQRMRGSQAYLTPSGMGCVWTGSSVTGSRCEYFIMASNLSPLGYFSSSSLRDCTSHSGGGGYIGRKQKISFDEALNGHVPSWRCNSWCRANLLLEEEIGQE